MFQHNRAISKLLGIVPHEHNIFGIMVHVLKAVEPLKINQSPIQQASYKTDMVLSLTKYSCCKQEE